MIIQTWGDALGTTFSGFAPAVAQFGAYLLAAIIIFAVGWVFGAFIGNLVEKIFGVLKIDMVLRQAGLEAVLKKGDIKLNSGAFIGGLLKWFIIAIFFLSALQVFHLDDVSAYLGDIVIGFLPRVIVSILIVLVSVIIGETVEKIVSGAAAHAHLTSSKFLGALTKWAIVIFAVLSALVELNIAAALIQILFIGIVVALSLAFGLAFGLGGRDAASKIIAKTMDDFSKRQ
jgi:Conserved TM helix